MERLKIETIIISDGEGKKMGFKLIIYTEILIYFRRICPGIHLADVEMFSVFVQIYSKCIIEPCGGMPDIEGAVNAGLVITPNPFKVKFTKRTECLVKK